jgi:glycosyltransferase involved in cell wall biosynthesis
MSRQTVRHFGPDPAYVGGMGSVIRILAEHRLGGERALVHPTWRPNARLASLPLGALQAAKLTRGAGKDVIHVHLSERGSFLREGALVVLSRRLRRPTVVTIHGAEFLSFAERHRRLAAGVLGHAHVVTCMDPDVLELVRALAPASHAELLPNPVAVDRDSHGAAQTDELVLFAGEIGRRKGADVLCGAWPLIRDARPRARCVMVGPAGDFAVGELAGLQARPAVGPEEMSRMLRSARVVVLPSRAEGMPMILTEAMSAGRPFVSTPVGGIPELAREGGGVLVAVGDDRELADRLIELLADPLLAERLGEQGRRFCARTRSTEVIGERLRRLYRLAAARA